MADVPVSPSGQPGGADHVEDAEPLSLGRRGGRILALVAIVAMAAFWAYALWGPTEKTFPGTLADPAWATEANAVCTTAANRLAELAPAYETRDAGARAEVIETANGYLAEMLVGLSAIAPAADSGNDGRMIQEWLGDWRTYLADRELYVVALQEDAGARFYVSEKDNRQVTEPVDFFAGRANDMPNCVTPGDLA
ncbi:MAG TPA: hypothetical protein VIY72_03460 [Acidimicrobiales bacterium]